VIGLAGDVGLVAAFGGGMLSFLSPCVLPLVPGYLSLMSGVSVAELGLGGAGPVALATRRRVLRATLLFVVGFTLVFTLLGLGASAVGNLLRAHQVAINRVAGAVVILMGLFLAGVLRPLALSRERRIQVSPARWGALAPPVMGMAFAFGWTPCIGPVLSGVLTLAAQQTSVRAVALLVAYSAGLGVPFVASGLALDRLVGVFGWFRRHGRVVDAVGGAVLVGFGALLFANRVSWLAVRLVDVLERLGLDRFARI
jgi:cytochrome c-type biogenesis protein